jgi:hypothetical protein
MAANVELFSGAYSGVRVTGKNPWNQYCVSGGSSSRNSFKEAGAAVRELVGAFDHSVFFWVPFSLSLSVMLFFAITFR